eukprot:9150491-Heterocapsa_arctica.AAC.1
MVFVDGIDSSPGDDPGVDGGGCGSSPLGSRDAYSQMSQKVRLVAFTQCEMPGDFRHAVGTERGLQE